jgi:hypothetical protein
LVTAVLNGLRAGRLQLRGVSDTTSIAVVCVPAKSGWSVSWRESIAQFFLPFLLSYFALESR